MTVSDLVTAWEKAYRKYGDSEAENIVGVTREVAKAWRALGKHRELPWWVTAAVHSAAEAFEHQAEDWARITGRPATDETDQAQPTVCTSCAKVVDNAYADG